MYDFISIRNVEGIVQSTKHARTRAQQRGAQPLIVNFIRTHGARAYDHHGGVVRYLDKRARKALTKEFGPQVMQQWSKSLDLYLVESATDGALITVGHRYKRIRRN